MTIIFNELTLNQKNELARNPNTSLELLTLLIRDKCSIVRWHVTDNPNTPPKTLTLLAKDKESYVRYRQSR